jgi:hypothetical protein
MSVWIKDTSPRLLAALACDDAAVSAAKDDARVTLQRCFYDIVATGFPAGFDGFAVVTCWIGGEPGQESSIGVQLRDPAGEILAGGTADYIGRPEPATYINLIYLRNLVLPEAGRYTVEVQVDGSVAGSFPLFALEPKTGGGDHGE